jgi:hypothetical protein
MISGLGGLEGSECAHTTQARPAFHGPLFVAILALGFKRNAGTFRRLRLPHN